MWGREMRAGLVFVLVSLFVGSAFREWKRAQEPRFADLIKDLESRDNATRRPADTWRGATSTSQRSARLPGDSAGSAQALRVPEPDMFPSGIDINRATTSDLERLPGIGPALAARIVADRALRGPFENPLALLRVSGIGPRTLARIRPFVLPTPTLVDSVPPIAN